jgi:putative methyltransferase (TIGR04325 family)
MTAARVRLLVRSLTPPVLWNALKGLKDRRARPAATSTGEPDIEAPPEAEPEPPEWEYVPEGWARASDPSVKGWNVDAIVEAYRAKWPSYVRALEGPRPLGVYHEVVAGEGVWTEDESAHNMLVSFAYVLALAAHRKERVSLLDWGGGIGHYYVLARAVLPSVEIEYASKDVSKLAAYGRELFPEARFYDDDSCLERRYDLVLVSGSLQYSKDWPATLARLADAADGYLYVTRLPVAFRAPSFVVLQRAYAYGYDTEYLGWVVNRDELLREAERAGLELVREFLLAARFAADGAPESPVGHRGFLFRRR